MVGCGAPRREDPCADVFYADMSLTKSQTDGSVVPFAEAEFCAGDCVRFAFDCSIKFSEDVHARCESDGQYYRLTYRTTPFTRARLNIFDADAMLRYEEELVAIAFESPHEPHCQAAGADFAVNFTKDLGTSDAAAIDP